MRSVAVAVVSFILVGSLPGSASAVASRQLPGRYQAPVAGALRVLRGFTPPPEKYQAGHLGVDLADAGGQVLAAGTGVVRFAGPVAGRGVVVISHPDGISTEYEPVTPSVTVGQRVRPGQPIGRLTGRHPGCPAANCLHWGARNGSGYLNPLTLLLPLGPVRLLPWDYPFRRADGPG
ncbi:MAG TPA: M23 family metallopeptidase [Jatrophihabitans sp.]|nr:M23 family metallopeptidase [Jatrophihabitans sp.]